MAIMNTEILVCKKAIVHSIKDIMNEAMEKYFEDEVLCKTKEKRQKMIKEKKEKTNTNTKHFQYLNSSSNNCTYIHKRGKNEGYMCHKKITKNGDKKKFICIKHNPNHIPKKKREKNSKYNKNK